VCTLGFCSLLFSCTHFGKKISCYSANRTSSISSVCFFARPQLLVGRQIFTIKFIALNQSFVSCSSDLVTPWSRVLLENLAGPQPSNWPHLCNLSVHYRVGTEERTWTPVWRRNRKLENELYSKNHRKFYSSPNTIWMTRLNWGWLRKQYNLIDNRTDVRVTTRAKI
jgi:hypothetical protein